MAELERVRRIKICLGAAALAPAVTAVLSIALLSLLSPAFPPAEFWPLRVAIMLAHQFVGALVASTIVAIGLRFAGGPGSASRRYVSYLPSLGAAVFVTIRSVAGEIGFDLH